MALNPETRPEITPCENVVFISSLLFFFYLEMTPHQKSNELSHRRDTHVGMQCLQGDPSTILLFLDGESSLYKPQVTQLKGCKFDQSIPVKILFHSVPTYAFFNCLYLVLLFWNTLSRWLLSFARKNQSIYLNSHLWYVFLLVFTSSLQ